MTIQTRIDALKAEIHSLEEQQRRCPHEWGSVKYDPRVTGGYSDKPLWWHPGRECADVWVPEERHPRWKRTCTKCGLAQHTERTKEVSGPGTIPGTTTKQQVPVFS